MCQRIITLIAFGICVVLMSAQNKSLISNSDLPAPSKGVSSLDKIYSDETHCLTAADMRGDRDASISCWCRDAIVDARYLYLTYLLHGKDSNLNGAYLTLEGNISATCGKGIDAFATVRSDWKWNGPEVIRTYPPDNAINRIQLESDRGLKGRWVPFTVQLIYRDAAGRIYKTEDYASREFIPQLEESPQKR